MSKNKAVNIKQLTTDQRAIVSGLLKEFKGAPVSRKEIREYMTKTTEKASGYGFITRNPLFRSEHGKYILPKLDGSPRAALAKVAATKSESHGPKTLSMTKDAIRKRAAAAAKKSLPTVGVEATA